MRRIFKKVVPLVLATSMVGAPLASLATPVYAQEKAEVDEDTAINVGNSEEDSLTMGGQGETNSLLDDNDEPENNGSANEVTPQEVNSAIQSIAESLVKFGTDETSIKSFTGILSRLSSAGSLAGGGMAVLQLLGIIEDPTAQELANIMSVMKQQNITLNEMNEKLNNIASQLSKIESNQELLERSNKALTYTSRWLSFKTAYLEEMESYMSKYQTWTLNEVKSWSYSQKHDNIYNYYTNIDGTTTQTFSTKKNMKLTTSDSGESIITEYTVGLPGVYVDEALKDYRSQGKWNPDTFRNDIIPLLSDAVTKAMTKGELGCSESFKTKWNSSSVAEKTTIANQVASDLLNTIAYISSVNGVRNNSVEANNLVTKMKQTWENTKNSESGVAAQIIPLMNTYCFEFEILDQMNKVYDGMAVINAVYSTLAMTVASQSDTLYKDQKVATRDEWVNGTDYLNRSKQAASTGYDNYSYVTRSLVESKDIRFFGRSFITTKEWSSGRVGLRGYSSSKWVMKEGFTPIDTTKLSIVNNSKVQVLYQTWEKTKSAGSKTFGDFLLYCGTGFTGKYGSEIITNYRGAQEFSLNEGVRMKCIKSACRFGGPSWFTPGNYYNIQTNPKLTEHTVLHDKVVADTFNVDSGVLTAYKNIVSRAQYCEGHWHWWNDEPWYFGNGDYNYSEIYKTVGTNTFEWRFDTDVNSTLLTLRAVPKRSSEFTFAEDEFNPLDIIEEEVENGVVDTTYKPYENVDILSLEDWKALGIDFLNRSNNDEDLDEYISKEIEEVIKNASSEGIEIVLSEDEKTALVNSLREMIRNAEKELDINKSINDQAYYDPFGIYGNDELTKKLAKKVLPDTEIATNGETMEPVKNMITSAFYEPCVYITYEETENGYELKPVLTYNVTPVLLVWGSQAGEVERYEISDEVMQELGLTMKIRLNAADAGDNDTANITHYDDLDTMNALDNYTVEIQGSGNDRYAELSVDECSPYTMTFSKSGNGTGKSKNAGTGDTTDITTILIVIGGAGAAIAGATAAILKRRKHN